MAMATFSIDSVAADCPQCRPAVPSCYPGIQLEQGLSLCWTSALDSCSYYSLPRPKGISVTRPASCRRQGSPTPRRKKTVDAADADDDVVVAVAAAAAAVAVAVDAAGSSAPLVVDPVAPVDFVLIVVRRIDPH